MNFVCAMLSLFLSVAEQHTCKTDNAAPQEPQAADAKTMQKGDGKVVLLDKSTFDKYIAENSLVLAKFATSWCGYCKELTPLYIEAAKRLASEQPDASLVEVDCEKSSELCKEMGVTGYPTLKLYRHGREIPYKGGRTTQEICSEVNEAAKLKIKELTSEQEEKDFHAAHPVSIVGYFADKECAEYKAYEAYAEKNLGKQAYAVAIQKGAPRLVLHRAADEDTMALEKLDEKSIEEFVAANESPLIAEIGPENYEKYMFSDIPLLYYFYSTPEQKKAVLSLKKLLATLKGKLNAVTIDANTFGAHADYLSLEKKWPALVIHDMKNKLKYTYPEIKEQDMAGFVEKAMAKKVEPTYKKGKVPEKNDGPVKKIVRDTFDEMVKNSGKSVLVMFHTPWCPHCKTLMPIMEELAKKAEKERDGVVVAEMDLEENDVEDMITTEIKGYPTLILFKGGKDKKEIEFSGDRTLEKLEEFLGKNGEGEKTQKDKGVKHEL